MRIRQLIVPFIAAVALVGGCSDDDNGGGGGGTTSTGSGGTGTGTGTGTGAGTSTGGGGGGGGTGGNGTCNFAVGEGGSSCTPPGYGGSTPTEDDVGVVTATVVDLQSAPAANIVADVCGLNLCVFASADGSGNVSADAGGQTIEEVRLLYGDGHGWARMGAPLPTVPDAAFGTISAIALPAMGSGPQLALGQEIASGDVTLSIDANAYVRFNALVYCEAANQGLRATTVQLTGGSAVLPAVDPSLNLEILYAIAPTETQICPPAQMVVPNTLGWSANADVEFYLHGVSVMQEWAPYGGWAKISNGSVSADGQTVATSVGEGIPELGLIGVRLAP